MDMVTQDFSSSSTLGDANAAQRFIVLQLANPESKTFANYAT